MIIPTDFSFPEDRYDEACAIAGGPVALHYSLRYAAEEWPVSDVPQLVSDLEAPDRWRDALKEIVARAIAAYESSTGSSFNVTDPH